MTIKIIVCDNDKAAALDAFINKTYEYGDNIMVSIEVFAPSDSPVFSNYPQNPKEAVKMLTNAFKGNKYFVKSGTSSENPGAAYVEFKPSIVQFYSDDISDWYLNTNLVASQAFNELMNFNPFAESAVRIYSTTSPNT